VILDFIQLDGEFAVSEFGELEDVIFAMMYLGLGLWGLWFVAVGGLALTIRCAHIHKPNVFARPAAIRGDSTGPALAVAGGGSIGVLQGFVFDVWIGVGRKGPDFADSLVHFSG
jgi:hypothetical protein